MIAEGGSFAVLTCARICPAVGELALGVRTAHMSDRVFKLSLGKPDQR